MPKTSNQNKILSSLLVFLTNKKRNSVSSKFNQIDFDNIDPVTPLQQKIDFLSAKVEKSPEDEIMLKEMKALLEEIKIRIKTDEIVIEEATQENASSFLKQLRSVQLKPVNEQKGLAQTVTKDGPPIFIVDPNTLASKLKSLKPNNAITTNHNEGELSELELKLAKQRALMEEDSVTSEAVLSQDDRIDNESISLNQYQVRILSMIIEEEAESQRNSIIPEQGNETHIGSYSDDSDSGLEEFKKIEAALELEEAEKQFEKVFQELINYGIGNAKPISKTKTPLSDYFKSSSPADESKPSIVGETLKPKI